MKLVFQLGPNHGRELRLCRGKTQLVMSTGRVNGENLTLFAASDDANAKDQVLAIGRDLGFDAVDAGPLANARWLETLGLLNIKLGYGQKLGPNTGFRLVGSPGAPSGRVEQPAGAGRAR